MPCIATADGVSGYVDVLYNSFDSETTDALGNVSRLESTGIGQRYSLTFTSHLAPYVRIYATGFFDKVDSTSVSNGTRSESTTTSLVPTVDLTLRSPIYTAGIKYSRRTDSFTTNGSPTATDIQENYQGLLGWKPPEVDLPSFQLRVVRTHVFDQERVRQNTIVDTAALTVNYAPTNTVSLNYRPTYTDAINKLNGLETETTTHAGFVRYADRFLRDRVTISTGYNVSYSELKVSVSGTGSVDTELVPFSGLSSIDDSPANDALNPNPALIDGNLSASAGINIGLPPPGGDLRERNIGLDFSVRKEVNRLLLWVDRPLPAAIAGSFSWSIYTSTDNQNWSFLTTVFPAPFGTFENNFEITFSPVTTRYLKVAVKPLSATVIGASGFPDIFVTELQAFSRQSADQVRGTTSSSSRIFDFDGRALLLASGPTLYYHVSYFLQKTGPPDAQRWTLANGLQATHRFNRVFSGSAGVGRDDYFDAVTGGMAYWATASLDAVPLRALRHTFLYSGRIDKSDTGGYKTNTYYLNNDLQVYSGVQMTLSGGLSDRVEDTGKSSESTDLKASATIQPHRTLGLNYFVSSISTESSGGGGPDSFSRRTDSSASVSYFPVATLYLTAGRTVVSDPERTLRTQNYGLNWSPSLGSTLQFSFSYTESVSNEDNAKNKTMGPTVQWRFARNAYLNASYVLFRTTSDISSADSTALTANVRATF
ncbi:MAG: hypothetical protein HGA43_02520 [Nitrospirae bacterium]|nr:hypothetical protein [Nitrospirota bacterium]